MCMCKFVCVLYMSIFVLSVSVRLYMCKRMFFFFVVHWPTGPPNSDLDDLGSVSFCFRLWRECALKLLRIFLNQYNKFGITIILPQWNPRPTIPELSTPAGPHALLLFILLLIPHYVLNLFFSSSLPSTLSFSRSHAREKMLWLWFQLIIWIFLFFSLSLLSYTLSLYIYISRAFSFLVSQQNNLLHRKERHAAYALISRFIHIEFVIRLSFFSLTQSFLLNNLCQQRKWRERTERYERKTHILICTNLLRNNRKIAREAAAKFKINIYNFASTTVRLIIKLALKFLAGRN